MKFYVYHYNTEGNLFLNLMLLLSVQTEFVMVKFFTNKQLHTSSSSIFNLSNKVFLNNEVIDTIKAISVIPFQNIFYKYDVKL